MSPTTKTNNKDTVDNAATKTNNGNTPEVSENQVLDLASVMYQELMRNRDSMNDKQLVDHLASVLNNFVNGLVYTT